MDSISTVIKREFLSMVLEGNVQKKRPLQAKGEEDEINSSFVFSESKFREKNDAKESG